MSSSQRDLTAAKTQLRNVLVAEDFGSIFSHVAHTIQLRLHAPGDLGKFRLPRGVQRRLSDLLDRQDQGAALTTAERREAEGLVELAEMISLLKLRAADLQASAQ